MNWNAFFSDRRIQLALVVVAISLCLLFLRDGNPTTLATWAVIAAILPMAFVGGLMGPYMRPIPIGASVAMLVFILLLAEEAARLLYS